MKESYKKGDSDSILALSLAGDIARCCLKRRQGYRWAGLLSFEKRNASCYVHSFSSVHFGVEGGGGDECVLFEALNLACISSIALGSLSGWRMTSRRKPRRSKGAPPNSRNAEGSGGPPTLPAAGMCSGS